VEAELVVAVLLQHLVLLIQVAAVAADCVAAAVIVAVLAVRELFM
jgi:hypothetical protein